MGIIVAGLLWRFGVQLAVVFRLLAIGFWGPGLGLAKGAFLAVPLTAIIRLVSLRIEPLRPLSRLLGGRIPKTEPVPLPA
jgi:hypothetical protein